MLTDASSRNVRGEVCFRDNVYFIANTIEIIRISLHKLDYLLTRSFVLFFCFSDYSVQLNVSGYENSSLRENEQLCRNHGDQNRKRNDERSKANGDNKERFPQITDENIECY